MNTSATVKYIYVTGWEVRTENISARDRRSGDASETKGKYFSRQKVFPCTVSRLLTGEISVIGIMFFPYHISTQLSRLAG